MIIGIDETGDFDPKSKYKQFVSAVAVDQNAGKHLIKKKQFLDWEATIPFENRDPKSGELKGRFLLPTQIHEFFFHVLMVEPPAYFTVIEFDPSNNPTFVVQQHKQWTLGQMNIAMTERKNANQPNWTKRWNEIIAWYGKQNYQHVVKINLLQKLHFLAFNQAFFYAQHLLVIDGGDDSNLKIQFKIDKDFVRSRLLRNFWDIHSFKEWQAFIRQDKPLVFGDNKEIMDALRKNFTFMNNMIDFGRAFDDGTSFVDSKNHFEVRLADIFGNILHRYHNKGQCERIWEAVRFVNYQERRIPVYSQLTFGKGGALL